MADEMKQLCKELLKAANLVALELNLINPFFSIVRKHSTFINENGLFDEEFHCSICGNTFSGSAANNQVIVAGLECSVCNSCKVGAK